MAHEPNRKKYSALPRLGFFALFLLALSGNFLFNNPSAEAAAASVHRFWSDQKQAHFYTISEEEKNLVIASYPEVWSYEGVAYTAFPFQEEDTLPVYRFWSDQEQSHFYTISEEEKNLVIASYPEAVWKYEGVAFYAYPAQASESTPLYRFWSDEKQAHFYTASPAEKTCTEQNYPEAVWRSENIGWWIPATGIDLNSDPAVCLHTGPEIRVGVWSYSRDDLTSGTGFSRIGANMDFVVKNSGGTTLAQIPAGTTVKINYTSGGNLVVSSDALAQNVNADGEVSFESASGNIADIIFETNVPKSYVKFRGKMKLKYSDTINNLNLAGESKRIWLINTLPMEHYVWGMGEITGTGAMEYNKVMTISFRTYGYFWLKESTKYIPEGFTVNATPGNQLYYGYDYEIKYPRIKQAALYTQGNILTSPQSSFDSKVAITPYSSWTDGRTRSFEERWGGTSYPWNQSVKDPYGKHPTKSTSQLESEGNHMVGLSANGALRLATDHGWDYQRIMKYYYTGVEFLKKY